jgi:8-oxo-dGTP diphosphatase
MVLYPAMSEKEILSPREVAEELRVNYRTILREIDRGNLTAKKIGRIYLITREELERYTSTRPKARKLEVAVAVVTNGQNVLLVKRKKKEGTLVWQFPAGTMKYSEKSSTRAEIECLEETGIHCVTEKYFGKRVHPDTNVVIHYWLCRNVNGKPYNADTTENEEARWVPRKKALGMITSDLYEPIRKYLEKDNM